MVVPEILGAAVDTTSNAAAFLLYCLATNPDKQEILRKEIMELLNSGEVTGKVGFCMKVSFILYLSGVALTFIKQYDEQKGGLNFIMQKVQK